MTIVICPGSHPRCWTDQFVAALLHQAPHLHPHLWVSPATANTAWSAHILQQHWRAAGRPRSPLVIVAFSAGCVAAIAAAHDWGRQGHTVTAILALDGWGVPMAGPFAVHRLSHDFVTHISTTWPGQGHHFYADPAVDHDLLWRSPQQVTGRQTGTMPDQAQPPSLTALDFLVQRLDRHRAASPPTP
jgi:hypothetical protein